MDNISRFGVFLPTYIWDDDGPERARNIRAFARRVEERAQRASARLEQMKSREDRD